MNQNDKIDKIMEDIGEIKIDLATHIRRTQQNEENIALLREDFKPIKSHVTLMNNLAKIIATCAAVLIFLKEIGVLNWFKIPLP